MNALERLLVDRIERSGPLPFAAFMSQALYEPGLGYYATAAGRTDWHGHYVTSPEVDAAFGHLWAGAFQTIWERVGSPPLFEVVEVGPGEAGFSRAVLDAATGPFGDAMRLLLVERSREFRERQESKFGGDPRVSWAASITEVEPVGCGVVFMNEVIDNLPVHLVERRGSDFVELHVGSDGGRFGFVEGPSSSEAVLRYLERIHVRIPEGHRYEVGLAAESLVARAARIVGRGALVIVDYGAEASDLAHRPNGSLVCYSATGVDDDPLARPGEKDITVHVNWTSLRNTLTSNGFVTGELTTQRAMLQKLGIAELDARLRAEFERAIADGRGADGVRVLSRRQALSTLADPGGLGALGVLVATRGIDAPG